MDGSGEAPVTRFLARHSNDAAFGSTGYFHRRTSLAPVTHLRAATLFLALVFAGCAGPEDDPGLRPAESDNDALAPAIPNGILDSLEVLAADKRKVANQQLVVSGNLRIYGSLHLSNTTIQLSNSETNNNIILEGEILAENSTILGADWINIDGGSLQWTGGMIDADRWHSKGPATVTLANVELQANGQPDVDDSLGNAQFNSMGGTWSLRNSTIRSASESVRWYADADSYVELLQVQTGELRTGGPGTIELGRWITVRAEFLQGGPAPDQRVVATLVLGMREESQAITGNDGLAKLLIYFAECRNGSATPLDPHRVEADGGLPTPFFAASMGDEVTVYVA